MFRQRLDRAARRNRPFAEPAHRCQPVIHDNSAGRREVKREFCRNFDQVIAAFDHFRRQAAALHAQNIGGASGMAETRQIHRIVANFHAHEAAIVGQPHGAQRVERVERQLAGGIRGIGRPRFGAIYGADRKHKTCTKGVCRPEKVADIDRFADAFDADSKIATHTCIISKPSRRRKPQENQP